MTTTPTTAQSLMNQAVSNYDGCVQWAEVNSLNLYQSGNAKLYQFGDGSMLLSTPQKLSVVSTPVKNKSDLLDVFGLSTEPSAEKLAVINALDHRLIVDFGLPSYTELLMSALDFSNAIRSATNDTGLTVPAGFFTDRMNEKVGADTIELLKQLIDDGQEMPF